MISFVALLKYIIAAPVVRSLAWSSVSASDFMCAMLLFRSQSEAGVDWSAWIARATGRRAATARARVRAAIGYGQ